MRRILFGFLAFSLLLSACASPAPATPTSLPTPDIAATVNTITGTMVAATLTAQPTATPPPTETPVPPPIETATSVPLLETPSPTPAKTATSIPFVGTLAPMGIGNGPIGYFLLENNTDSSANVSINGYTEPGNKPVFIAYDVKANGTFPFTVPYGTYKYVVYVGNKMFSGEFRINNKDKTTMRISLKKVIVVGP